jgi:autotransporter strand-loop-strand O-heptosyltransferase
MSRGFQISFKEGAKVTIDPSVKDDLYTVKFKDRRTQEVVYQTAARPGYWCTATPLYFIDWEIDILNSKGERVLNERLNLWGKRVLIFIDTPALGDTVAWAPYASRFAAIHNCKVICSSDYPGLFMADPNTSFVGRTNIPEWDVQYKLGYYFKENWEARIKKHVSTLSLQEVATSILGMEFKEIRPTIRTLAQAPRPLEKKYVCIAVQSTAQCKLWNRDGGWDEVVEYLNSRGLEVVCLDKHAVFGSPDKPNRIPKNAMDKTGDYPLAERITYLSNCEFFIGLGSGLSWLAWALEKPVVMVSGFSKPFSEFNNPHRVFNDRVCNGCWNDKAHPFDPGNWFWCPRGKDFECSKEITFEMVKEKIDLCLK